MYDFAIIGGGIAGLTTAEIFSRSGYKVILIEKNSKICSESSGLHHEWFHFGSLYSIFPNKNSLRILVGGIDDLLLYYRDFKNMNLKIDHKGKIKVLEKKNSWFKNNNFNYLFRKKNMSPLWKKKFKSFCNVHKNFEEYDWRKGEASKYIPNVKNKKETRIKIKRLNGKKFFKVKSFDCPMESTLIANDILESFLNYNGKLKKNCEIKKISKSKEFYTLLDKEKKKIHSKKVIFANGSGINKFTKSKVVKSFLSPLIITYPNLCKENYIIMSDNKKRAVNHVLHKKNNKKYSILGGGDYVEKLNHKNNDLAMLSRNLKKLAIEDFGNLENLKTHTYFGVKNEVIKEDKRNYIYTIKKIKDDFYYINPGKFSLSFSLAINTFKKIVGHYPNPTIDIKKKLEDSKKLLRGNYHKNFVFKKFLKN